MRIRRILSLVLALCLALSLLAGLSFAEPEAELVGLKDAFAPYFKIGTALSANEVRKAQAQALTLQQFNSVTCENEMKPQNTLDQQASQAAGDNVTVAVRLNSDARAILKFCEDNEIPMRGHVIAWHSQTPGWLFREGFQNNGAIVSPEIMDQRLDSYVKNFFQVLKDEFPKLKFYAFDVVNEAFTDNTPATMRSSGESDWISVYKDETFIYKAFEAARKYAPEDCLLCYNDYNEYNSAKLDAIYKLCKDLYDKGLLDAVGMQSHLSVNNNPSIETYRKALEKYDSIGCKIMITELDATQNNGGEAAQAEYYQQLFETLVDYHEKIDAVVFWGTQDGMSWRSSGSPLPFDRDYQPKACYWSILDAVADHEHDYVPTVVAPTCTENGYTGYVCSVCGRTRVGEQTPALGHDWDEGVVTLAPTETEPGIKTFTCKRCGETKTKRLPRLGATVPDDIDFTDPESAEQFELRNPASAAIVPGTGLPLITTRPAFEDCKGQNQGDQATTPEDVVVVPVEGDWTATLAVQFDTNGAGNGYYQFFGFYAMQGEDYQNLAGIRGGDKAMQNFIRQNGTITHQDEDGVVSSPGFDTSGKTYYLRLEKIGDTYTCSRSDDGETFTEMFAYEATGIEADHLVIDAYTGMTTGYKFTLKSLTFEAADLPDEPELDKTGLEKAIQSAEALDPAAYTPESAKNLEKALAAAKKALDEAKTQAELDQAAITLLAAIADLQNKPEAPALDKGPLEQAIEDAEKIEKDKYTDESVKALDEALAAARKALDEAKTQDELDAAKKELDDAVKALVEKPIEPTPTPTPTPTPIPTPTPHDCPGKNFTDMPAVDYWSHAPIDWAIVNKITVGTSETTFGPTEGCTRAQVVTFLWRAAKEPAPTSKENPFKDVKESDYFYNAVLWAVEKGITVGTEPDKFSPGETCTRAQIVTFLYRYEGKPEVKPDDSFTDVKADDYFADSVAWAVANGITKGTDPGKFSPSDTCTREQVVTFLYRDIAE